MTATFFLRHIVRVLPCKRDGSIYAVSTRDGVHRILRVHEPDLVVDSKDVIGSFGDA